MVSLRAVYSRLNRSAASFLLESRGVVKPFGACIGPRFLYYLYRYRSRGRYRREHVLQ